jgi:hypothetical protein
MSRAIDSGLLAAMSAGGLVPAFFAQLEFRSTTEYVWTGPGPLVINGQTFTGVGSLASVGVISEGTGVDAKGTTVTLSGIDPAILNECLTDIKSGAIANIWFGAFDQTMTLIAQYLMFSGVVDTPEVTVGAETVSITLALESRLVDLGRAMQRRYTAADQNVTYPTDIAFNWVEILNDAAWNWGS